MVFIILSFTIEPKDLNDSIYSLVKDKATKMLLNKEIKDVGLIKDIKNIEIDNDNFSIMYSGNIKCRVKVDADIYLIKVDDIIETKVKSVSFHGYYLDEPLETFVMLNKDKKKLIEGDKITVKITKVSYINDKFIVLANIL